ncbi:hypothetical protein B0H14DRAFT_3484170 [Mycena olivaceomarginata]|nr:hypothetical protein B0H14DRAFT_3484170 [Mycena olivaceomarginata]
MDAHDLHARLSVPPNMPPAARPRLHLWQLGLLLHALTPYKRIAGFTHYGDLPPSPLRDATLKARPCTVSIALHARGPSRSNPTGYRFKLALLKNNYEMLLGQSIISYLQQKGFDENCKPTLNARLPPAFRVVVPEGPRTQHVRPSSMVIRPLRAAPAPAPSQSAPKSAPVPAPTPVGTQAPQPAGFEHILNHFLGAGATLAQHHGCAIPYNLDETSGWSTDPASIEAALTKAKAEGTTPKALVINPGNPTGALLNSSAMEELVLLCGRHSLVPPHRRGTRTTSTTRKTTRYHVLEASRARFGEVGAAGQVPLVSFHSISKGVSGDCGRRGGYFELTNVSAEVWALVYKLVSVGPVPAAQRARLGWIAWSAHPKKVTLLPALEIRRPYTIHAALVSRTILIMQCLNALLGVLVRPAPRSPLPLPRIMLSARTIAAVKEAGKEPDALTQAFWLQSATSAVQANITKTLDSFSTLLRKHF